MAKPSDEDLTELPDVELDELAGGPNRLGHDQIGNFNFKVEIEGVTQGTFKNIDGLSSDIKTTKKP